MEEKKEKKEKFVFEFEQHSWHNSSFLKCDLSTNCRNKIEQERTNIEKDLKLLGIIQDERTRQKNIMMSVLKIKKKLEKKMKTSTKN